MPNCGEKEVDLNGKICVVTGASSGLGHGTALLLARRGATVVMLSRECERGRAAWENARAMSPNGRVDWIPTDLASLASVRAFVGTFSARYGELHRLFNCAGIVSPVRKVTADGLERVFQVNYLSAFLLTNLLHQHLIRAGESRVINVSGRAHRASLFAGMHDGTIRFADLQGDRSYSLLAAAEQSMLAKILFTYELARHWTGTGITVCTLCPGLTRTALGDSMPPVPRFLFRCSLKLPLAQSVEQSANNIVALAATADAAIVNGKYYEVLFRNLHEARSSKESHDVAIAKRLWEVSERLSGLKESTLQNLGGDV